MLYIYVSMYLCIYVSMYACMYVCIYIYTYMYNQVVVYGINPLSLSLCSTGPRNHGLGDLQQTFGTMQAGC